MSAMYSVVVGMLAAGTRTRVEIKLFGDLRVGDCQAYACTGCGMVTPWRTGRPSPKRCETGCTDGELRFVGKFTHPPPELADSSAFLWRPELSSDDVARIIEALGSAADELTDDASRDADDEREITALRTLRERLAWLGGEPAATSGGVQTWRPALTAAELVDVIDAIDIAVAQHGSEHAWLCDMGKLREKFETQQGEAADHVHKTNA